MAINYIFSDIDGTLILNREPLIEEFIKEVKEVSKQGAYFTFASGRLPYMIQPLLEQVGLPNQLYVACNGALVKQGNKTVYQKKFSLQILKEIVEKALNSNMTVLYAIDELEYVMAENSATVRKRTERGTYHPLRKPTEEEWLTLDIVKLNILQDDSSKDMSIFEVDFKDIEKDILITRYGSYGLELVSKGVNKLKGIERVLKELNGSLEETAAIGDNENDFEMIAAVSFGCAVENATIELKNIADFQAKGIAIQGATCALKKIKEINREEL